MAQYQAEEIYSTKRTEIEATLREEIKKKYDANYLILNGILIRSIKLPNQTHEASSCINYHTTDYRLLITIYYIRGTKI